MKKGKKDAFGAAALAFSGGDTTARFELKSDAGPDSDEIADYFQEYEGFDNEYKAVLPFAEGRVLDIGCGAGRFALYLQQQGLEVVGIDESEGAIAVCKKRGVKRAHLMDIKVINAKQLGKFDTFLLLGHNLGIGGTPEGVKKLLRSLKPLANENAKILVNSIDKTILQNEEWARRQVEYSQGMGRFQGQTQYRVVFGEHDTGWFNWIHMSPDELNNWSTRCGWKLTLVAKRYDTPAYWAGVLERGGWDAFGAAAMAYYKGEQSRLTAIYDDGKIGGFEMQHYFEEIDPLDEKILGEARGRVLDMGCGAGRYALYLQERGLTVVGIDESPQAIEVCKLRGLRECYIMDARKLNARKLGLFETIIFMGSNLGIGGTPEGLINMLRGLHKVTAPDARILFSCGHAVPDNMLSQEDKKKRLDKYLRYGYAGQDRFRVVFGKYDTGQFNWIGPTPDDLRAWAEQAGWRVGKMHFGLDENGKINRMVGAMEGISISPKTRRN